MRAVKLYLDSIAGHGFEEDIGDCPKTCGGAGCTHSDDVGVCCWGFNVGPWVIFLKKREANVCDLLVHQGTRNATRDSFKTVRALREACYLPDACPPV